HPQDRRLRSDALEVGQLERAHDLKRVDHRLRAARRWGVGALRHGAWRPREARGWWVGALRHGSWRRDREQQDNETDPRERHGTAPEGCDSEADDRLLDCLPWLELAGRPPPDYIPCRTDAHVADLDAGEQARERGRRELRADRARTGRRLGQVTAIRWHSARTGAEG